MDCIVLAGGGAPDPDDPLYTICDGKVKALLDMGGRTMLERVVDALQESESVDDIVVVGLGSDMGMRFSRPVYHLPEQGGLIQNGLAGVKWVADRQATVAPFLACASDIPTLTGAIVDNFVEVCQPLDGILYYNFVTRETMQTRFPDSRRTFVKLKGVQIAGGDLVLASPDIARTNQEFMMALSDARKHAWKLARQVGLFNLLKYVTRQLSVADIEEIGARVFGGSGKIIMSPYAELAMDADKPQQIEILRADLARQKA